MPTVFRPPLIQRVSPAPRRELWTWLWPLNLNLLRPFANYDHPNPRVRAFPTALRTWLDPLKLNLLLERFFVYEYPNPAILRFSPGGLHAYNGTILMVGANYEPGILIGIPSFGHPMGPVIGFGM